MCPCPQAGFCVPCRHLRLEEEVSRKKVDYAEQMQVGIHAMHLLLWKCLRSFDCGGVGSISCLHPTKPDTAAVLTQAASGLEEEKNHIVSRV